MAQDKPEEQAAPEPEDLNLEDSWPQDWDDEDEEFDPELMALAEARSRGSILRPILMIAVIAFAASIILDWQEELAYFFSSSDPIDIGNVTDFPALKAQDPTWSPELPHNRYVELSGVPTRRSQSPKYRYFKLVGADIYVEVPRDDYIEDPYEREMQRGKPGDVDRTFFEGSGRLLAFAQMPERYTGIREYYNDRYNTRFCEQYDERALEDIARRRRETIIHNWGLEYKAATEEERQEQGLTPAPTEEQLQEVFTSEPLCVDAYLIQADTAPSDNWWYLLLTGLFSAFMIFNGVMLVRWFMRLFRS